MRGQHPPPPPLATPPPDRCSCGSDTEAWSARGMFWYAAPSKGQTDVAGARACTYAIVPTSAAQIQWEAGPTAGSTGVFLGTSVWARETLVSARECRDSSFPSPTLSLSQSLRERYFCQIRLALHTPYPPPLPLHRPATVRRRTYFYRSAARERYAPTNRWGVAALRPSAETLGVGRQVRKYLLKYGSSCLIIAVVATSEQKETGRGARSGGGGCRAPRGSPAGRASRVTWECP